MKVTFPLKMRGEVDIFLFPILHWAWPIVQWCWIRYPYCVSTCCRPFRSRYLFLTDENNNTSKIKRERNLHNKAHNVQIKHECYEILPPCCIRNMLQILQIKIFVIPNRWKKMPEDKTSWIMIWDSTIVLYEKYYHVT